MKHVFEIAPGERLKGLQVIGFHGRVAPEHTPGRREPVLADSEGRLVTLERVVSSPAMPPRQSVRVRSGPPWRGRLQKHHATQLESPWPAYWGHIVVVVGRDEQALARALATAEPRRDDPAVNTFVQWLGEAADAPPPPLAQRLGDMVAWYCDPSQAFALYQRISHVAKKEMIRAASAEDDGALYRASWWLSRAAVDDADRFLAAVGLEGSGEMGMARDYVDSTFWKKPQRELKAELDHARDVFSSLMKRASLVKRPVGPEDWSSRAPDEETLRLLRTFVQDKPSNKDAYTRFIKRLAEDIRARSRYPLYMSEEFSSLYEEATEAYGQGLGIEALYAAMICASANLDLKMEELIARTNE